MRGAGACGVALVGRFRNGHQAHHLDVRHHELGRAAALRNAMLTYMNTLNAYPAFWAPFSVIGEGAAR
jgi:hypothetical protein